MKGLGFREEGRFCKVTELGSDRAGKWRVSHFRAPNICTVHPEPSFVQGTYSVPGTLLGAGARSEWARSAPFS